jgi:hypothetical protein
LNGGLTRLLGNAAVTGVDDIVPPILLTSAACASGNKTNHAAGTMTKYAPRTVLSS